CLIISAWSSCRPTRRNSTRSSGYGYISETIAYRTAFSRPLARSSTPVVTLGIGCSAKPDAFDPCVPILGSNMSAINQHGIILNQPDCYDAIAKLENGQLVYDRDATARMRLSDCLGHAD